MIKISIAMATYNGARFIREQLDSLAAQSARPHELFIADDGSSDSTIEIANYFSTTAPFPVRFLRNEQRLGFRANFMNCASACSGELIAFCDQDDIWHPDKLRRMASHFEDENVLLACHNVALVDEQRRPLGTTVHKIERTGKNSIRDLLPFAYSHGFTQIFRKGLLPFSKHWIQSTDCTAPDHPMAHDQFYVFIALLLGYVVYDDDILADYRQHGANATGNVVVHSPLEEISRKFKNRTSQYEQIALVTRNRLHLLRIFLSDAELTESFPRLQKQAENAIALYDSYLARIQRRLQLYSSKSAAKKAAILTEGLISGDYKFSMQNHWGFTMKGAIRDMTTLFD